MTKLGTVRRLALALATGLVAAASVATPAWAHARLLSTTPTDGAVVTAPVAAVTLTFTDPLKEQFTTVVVTGGGGAAHASGSARVSGTTVTQRVRDLPAGPVRVAWRTVSQDGHPVEGQFTFTVTTDPAGAGRTAVPGTPGAGIGTAAPALDPGAGPAATSGAGPSTPDATAPLAATGPGPARRWPWLLGGGAVLLLAAAGTLLWSGPRRRT
ncbi:copper resistance protein CopC [Longispora sp. K20-0274]|uniref:copper resistance CopC family protein n=1 Tax=Longispora sp. K20-0274 TaxID=3088255 RepID=UPI00399AAF3A